MPDIYFNPDVAVTSPPAGFISGVARTFDEAKTIMSTHAGSSNLTAAANGIYQIFIETTGGTFIQEEILADGFTTDAANTYYIIGRNNPDIREPLNAPASSGSTIKLRDTFTRSFGENVFADLNIKPDLTNTNARSLVYLYSNSTRIHTFFSSALSGGSANSAISFCDHFDSGQITNGVISGFGRASYGAYRKTNAGTIVQADRLTVYKSAVFRADSNLTLTNSAIFNTPFYLNGVAPASDYNATSNAEITGATGANNQFNLLATDCFVDPDNGDFTPKAGSPLIGAASDGGNIGAVQGAQVATLSITKPAFLQAGAESVGVTVTNASADNLIQSAFSVTYSSFDISSYITSFVNDGSSQYTLSFTLPASLPRQFDATGYDLTVTENSVSATQTEVPYAEPAGKDYVNLATGFIAVKLWEQGEVIAAGAQRMAGNTIFSNAAGLADSQITPADGVDGWVEDSPSSSVADGWTGTALTVGTQAVFDVADGYSVSQDGTWGFNESASNDVVINIYFIAPDGTVSPASTYTYVLPSTEDLIPPTISISATGNAVSFTISEDVADFVVGDISVSAGSLSGFTGSGQSYAATFNPPANSTGTATISVAAGTITDAAGNANTAGDSATIAYDTRPQTIVFPTTAGDEVTDKQGNLLASTEFYFHIIALDLSVTENVSGTTDASGFFPALNLSTVPVGTDVQIIPYSNVNRDFGIPPILATVGVAI